MKVNNTLMAFIRLLAFTFVLVSIVLQSVIQSATVYNDQKVTAIDFVLDIDMGENESQEEDEAKDKKIEFFNANDDQSKGNLEKKTEIFEKQCWLQHFAREIQLPPPEYS
mgnify:CR=1 FL=1